MAKLTFNSKRFALREYESVLDCLLRNGQAIPYACKAGMCQACLVRAVDCEATPDSRKWIKPALQARGYTLACQWVPGNDAEAALPGIEEFSVPVRVAELQPLNATVLRVRLEVTDPARMFAYQPGQYLTLINPAGIARSYSIANDFDTDGFIELHVSRTSHGVFTGWLFDAAAVDNVLHMRGPAGDCYYSNMDGNMHPIVLAGTGTGLAPLYGIARAALKQGHRGDIHLWHGGRSAERLYYTAELQQLARDHNQFFYHACVAEGAAGSGYVSGDMATAMDAALGSPALQQTRVYLCGAPDFVHGMRKRMFLKGVRATHIHCDPFTERNVRP